MIKRNPLPGWFVENQPKSRPSRPRHEWSPTSDALGPFTGVCFLKKQIPRDGLCVLLHDCRCALEAVRNPPSRDGERLTPRSHSVVARLQFSRGNTTRHKVDRRCVNPKAYHHTNPQGRRQEELSDARNFRVGTQTMHSLLATVCVRENAPAPEGLCGWCCLFWTGTHRVAA